MTEVSASVTQGLAALVQGGILPLDDAIDAVRIGTEKAITFARKKAGGDADAGN